MAVSGKENGFFGKEKPNLSTDNFLLIDSKKWNVRTILAYR